MTSIIPDESIMRNIYMLRGQKILLDKDLAILYGVETKVLKQAVRRNINRFPEDFMFELTESEFTTMRSQIVTSSSDSNYGGTRYLPFAFTEHGLLMLGNVLRSDQAIQMSINIVKIFVKMRETLKNNELLFQKLKDIEYRLEEHDNQFAETRFEIKKLLELDVSDEFNNNNQKIGYRLPIK